MKRAITLIVVGTLVACGGVDQERFDALAAQVEAMKSASEPGEGETPSADLEQRMADLEKTSAASIEILQELVKTLQRELAELANSRDDASEATAWADADTVLGIATEPVKPNGELLEVDRGWLFRELRALAVTRKVPKLSGGKKGVAIRGFRPKSLFDTLGLKNGDVIVSINGQPVTSADQISTALGQKKNPTAVQLERKRQPLTVTFKVVD